MNMMDDAIKSAVREFVCNEFPNGFVLPTEYPVIAAVGSVAPSALSSPVLRERLAERNVVPRGYESFASLADLLAAGSWSLALVLSPHKRDIASSCGSLAPAAAAIGVVDTLLRTEKETVGINTNAYAAAGTIQHLVGARQPRRVLIAGTGASSRSVAFGLRRRFPQSELGFVGRSPKSARAVATDVGSGTVVEDLVGFKPDLIVNATTVGQTDDTDTMAFDLQSILVPGVRYLDLNNRTSALQMAAVGRGCVTVSGVFMQILTNAIRAALLGP